MRPLPSPSECGSWDQLPACPDESELDLSRPDLKDALQRRDRLIDEWWGYVDYPHGVWVAENIAQNPDQAQAWRNWLLRRAWEGIQFINGNLRRWSNAASSSGNSWSP